MNLVIVESPNKVKKIQEILDKMGGSWKVEATAGHIRDLPLNEMGVEPPLFVPKYEIIPDKTFGGRVYSKKDTVIRLIARAKSADAVYLATDPDREGESIAWHLQEALSLKNPHRITFGEITAKAVIEAVKNPRKIDFKLAAAQEARRVLDRFCGYMCSRPVSDHVGEKASAGRVQSVALRLLVEREQAIRIFVSRNHYGVELFFDGHWNASWNFKALLQKDEDLWMDDVFAKRVSDLRKLEVIDLKNSQSKSSPPAPFTTSTMQQGASVALGMQPEETMKFAQNLFAAGHISYHRTDSPNLSDDAIQDIFKYCTFKKLPISPTPRKFPVKGNAQEAHEAIRPSHVEIEEAGDTLEERKLYKLIRDRAIASQMADALYDVRSAKLKSVDFIDGNKMDFSATGRTLKYAGWKTLTQKDAADEEKTESKNQVPQLVVGSIVDAINGILQSKKTEPPKRYTEASLVKDLDERGIGRPATYASILANIRVRGYYKPEKKTIIPTPLGEKVIGVMVDKFSFMTYEYTRNMEERLDKIAEGKDGYLNVVKSAFEELTKEIAALGKSSYAPSFQSANGMKYSCPLCKCELRKRKATKGNNVGKLFWGCSSFPNCTKVFNHDEVRDAPQGIERDK